MLAADISHVVVKEDEYLERVGNYCILISRGDDFHVDFIATTFIFERKWQTTVQKI